jgi:hypothetical protein
MQLGLEYETVVSAALVEADKPLPVGKYYRKYAKPF